MDLFRLSGNCTTSRKFVDSSTGHCCHNRGRHVSLSVTEGDADVDVTAEHHLTPSSRCCVTSHKPAASGARLQIEQFTVPVGVS